MNTLRRLVRFFFALPALALLAPPARAMAEAVSPPSRGERAPAFVLKTLADEPVELAGLAREHKVVLVVLRGWPGYQCPFCTTQVYEYVGHAADFARRGVKVVMVYPGPAEKLREHAGEFMTDKRWPADFSFVLDPDYAFTRRYGLRWDAKDETAYPSTFIIDEKGEVRFAHVSREHGDRVSAAAALRELDRID